jgi:hypothetical protein
MHRLQAVTDLLTERCVPWHPLMLPKRPSAIYPECPYTLVLGAMHKSRIIRQPLYQAVEIPVNQPLHLYHHLPISI